VIWGREWDELLARDVDGVLVNQMNRTPDGAFQTFSVEDGAYNREHFFGPDPRLRKMVEHMSDRQIEKLPRGGHDYRKVYAAFDAASKHTGQPTVILAHTIKGWTIEALEGRNATHQMKKLKLPDLLKFRDRLYLPMSDRDIEEAYESTGTAPFFHPGDDSPEIEYMLERRRQLGGSLPKRVIRAKSLILPGKEMYSELKQGSGKNKVATTMATVRLLKDWMKDPNIGQRIVPIAPDEYRTFGMDSMFPSAKVYDPAGMQYEAVDRKLLLAYKQSAQGQLLHEGISEAGALASATAAGSTYSTHGEHMIPFYIFYSMFGFHTRCSGSSGPATRSGRWPTSSPAASSSAPRPVGPPSPVRGSSTPTATRRCWPPPTRRSCTTTRRSPTRSRTSWSRAWPGCTARAKRTRTARTSSSTSPSTTSRSPSPRSPTTSTSSRRRRRRGDPARDAPDRSGRGRRPAGDPDGLRRRLPVDRRGSPDPP